MVPLVAGAALLIGLCSGLAIQGWRDSVPATTAAPTPAAAQVVPTPTSQEDVVPVGDAKKPHRVQAIPNTGAVHE
ncbi:MAG: hypothetical protein ABR905_21475 [Terracidiphilus sp.]